MNDRMKDKIETEQMNHQTANPKTNSTVFLFLPNAHFLKTILTSRSNGTFGFVRHTSRPFTKPKEPFFWPTHPKLISILHLNFKKIYVNKIFY